MRSEVKQRIASLRKENYSYAFIGRTLHLSPNTVKSICRRNGYEAFGNIMLPIRTKQSSMKMFSIWYRLNYSDALKCAEALEIAARSAPN